MILRDSLYTVLSADPSVPAYRIALHADHPIYRAHFPGRPVTPGVCLVQMAVELLSLSRRQPLCLAAAKSVKFLSVVSPVETPELSVAFHRLEPQADGTVRAQATVAAGPVELTKLSFTCREPAD